MSTTSAQQSDDNETATIASTTGDVQVTTQESAQIDNTELSGNAAPPEEQDGNGSSASKKILCGVCSLNESKYKCPRCYLPYCSVACNKQHRENHPPDPEPKPEPDSIPNAENNTVNQSTDPGNPFRALETSDKLRLLFRKYPGLPDQLLQIHAATLPPREAASQPSGIPASLLKGLPPKKETWNHDIGIQNGKEALRKARRAIGEQGDAIREYSELILHLINAQDSESDVADLLRQQLAQEDSKLIERLMTEEKR